MCPFCVRPVQGEAAGIGIREAEGRVTDDRSRFVPHRIR